MQSDNSSRNDIQFTLIKPVTQLKQGIIDMNGNGMETFAKKPEFLKLLRELKSTPVRHYKKKFTGFSRMSVMANLLCFGCFAAG